jgi:hypothetical protein
MAAHWVGNYPNTGGLSFRIFFMGLYNKKDREELSIMSYWKLISLGILLS